MGENVYLGIRTRVGYCGISDVDEIIDVSDFSDVDE